MKLGRFTLGSLIAVATVLAGAGPAAAAPAPTAATTAACSRPVETFPPAGVGRVSYAGTLRCTGPSTYDRMLTITLVERRAPYRDVRHTASCHFAGSGQCTARVVVPRRTGATYRTGAPLVTTTILPPL